MIHSELRALYSYWNRLRAGRRAPLRLDIDPRDMACDARNLFILENLGRGNIRFRLAGTAIIDAFGMELRGMNVRAIMATPARESFLALIIETLEEPGVGYARLRNAADERGVWEVNLLPLRSDLGAVDRIIGCLHPLSDAAHRVTGAPLRFRIEQMSVEPVDAPVREFDRGAGMPGWAEGPRPFRSRPPGDCDAPYLTAIDGDGGRSRDGCGPDERGSEGGADRRRRGAHLRLVKK